MPIHTISKRTKILFSILFPTMLISWNQGFDLGAFGSILYRSAITAWVFVTSIFIGLLYVRAFEKVEIKNRSFIILAMPVLWPAIDYLDHHIENDYIHYFVIFDYIIVLFGLAYAAYIFLRLIKSDIFNPLSTGNKIFIILLAGAFNLFGFLAGQHNHLFLECAHFELSGDYVPDNCKKHKDLRTLHRTVW